MDAVPVWKAADLIVKHFSLAMDGLATLDFLARQPAHNPVAWDGRIREIRLMTHQEWDDCKRLFAENEERAAVMRLFVCFEGLLRRDGAWRGSVPAAMYHANFVQTATKALSALQHGKGFVTVHHWLNCWSAVDKSIAEHPLTKTMRVLSNVFSSARNPLMHDDRSPSPPLIRIKTQLETAARAIRSVAHDFPGPC